MRTTQFSFFVTWLIESNFDDSAGTQRQFFYFNFSEKTIEPPPWTATNSPLAVSIWVLTSVERLSKS